MVCPEIMAHHACKTPLLVYRILKVKAFLPWQELLPLPKAEEQFGSSLVRRSEHVLFEHEFLSFPYTT